MATLALSVAAKAAAGSLGLGTFGTAALSAGATFVGGLIDQRLLAQLAPGSGDVVGPRLESFDITGSEEGAPILRAYGPEVRVDKTQMIYLSDWIEETNSQSVGSGKRRSTVTNYAYYRHMAVAVCEGPISRVKKLRANGKVIYDVDDAEVGADLYTNLTIHKGTHTQAADSFLESLVNPDGSGTPTPAFRGTCYFVLEKFSLDPFGRSIPTFSADIEASDEAWVVEPPSSGAKAWVVDEQRSYIWSTHVNPPRWVPRSTEQKGDETTVASRTTTAPPSLDPEDIGTVYIVPAGGTGVFEGRETELATYQGDYLVRDVVRQVVLRGELDDADVDTSQLTGICRGVMIKQPEPISSTLDLLAAAYHFRARIDDGRLVFFPMGEENIAYIDAEDIGVQGGEKAGMSVTDVADIKLPREVNVQYVDPDEDLTIGSQRELRVSATGPSAVALNLPITMSASEARAAASRVLWEKWTERRVATFALGPRWVSLQENDLAVIDWAGTRYHIRITEIQRGHNYQHDVTGVVRSLAPGVSAAPTYLSSSPPADTGSGAVAPIPYTPPTMTYELMDLPPLLGTEAGTKGLFYAQSTPTEFRGGVYRMAGEEDGLYADQVTTSTKSILGIADTVLADTPQPELWDEGNTVEVTLDQGVLTNATKQQVLAGTNLAAMGNFDPDSEDYGFEIIAFRTAEYLGGTSYRLSGLVRARRNTHDYTDGHTAGESFVLLSSPEVKFLPLDATDVETPRWVKFVPVGATEDDVTARNILIMGNTTKPFAPSAVTGSRLDDDWTLNWKFRSRVPQIPFNGHNPSNPEDLTTDYVITVYEDDTFTTVKRTFYPGNAFTDTYTGAQQIADFGSVQGTLYVSAEQRVNTEGGFGFSNPFASLTHSKKQYSTLTA